VGWEIDEECVETSIGPARFNVKFALEHGWDISTVRRCWELIRAVTLGHQVQVNVREGLTRTCETCEQSTYPDKPCHLCAQDEVEMELKLREKMRTSKVWVAFKINDVGRADILEVAMTEEKCAEKVAQTLGAPREWWPSEGPGKIFFAQKYL
jgi:hypothetical protein